MMWQGSSQSKTKEHAMSRRAIFGLALALAAAGAMAAQAPKETEEKRDVVRLVVTHDETPLMFGEEKVGELAEGTIAEVIETRGTWVKIRIPFGPNWVQGWVRQALTALDSLADVKVTLAPARRLHVYQSHTLPGKQFLEVRVKFEATDRSPPRVYFNWPDEASADIYLSYGRDKRIPPYGFMRRKPLSARRIFDSVQKRQVLLLPRGTTVIETYVFAIPIRVRDFDLVLKDKVEQVRVRHR
jgi:hypothetical protein